VAELSLQEKLQPALLDRLTDDEPDKKAESRAKRVLSLNRLKSCVLRDLAWLLNCGNLEVTEDLEDLPEVQKSVLNYGVPDLAGKTVSATEVSELEREIRDAILNFEPRILADTLTVRVSLNREAMSTKTMSFVIEGQLWAQPLPLSLFLSTDLDLETGSATIKESSG
jgi:type VI secretion system protein ImpF